MTETRALATISFVFDAELVEEDDGRWSAGVPALPGCATWGFTRDEALRNLHDAVAAYVRALGRAGKDVPTAAGTQVTNQPKIAVTV